MSLMARRERRGELVRQRDELLVRVRGLELAAARSESRWRAVGDAVRHLAEVGVPAVAMGGDAPPAAGRVLLGDEVAGLLDGVLKAVREHTGEVEESLRRLTALMGTRVQGSAHRIQEQAEALHARFEDVPGVAEAALLVDHESAQQARQAQSVRVLAGAYPGQQWPEPMALAETVRAASGRVADFRRVQVTGSTTVGVAAAVVEPVVHLVAELLANATACSAPDLPVMVQVLSVQRGAVIAVDDCGVGMTEAQLVIANRRVSGRRLDLLEVSEHGQTGLAVVGELAVRYGLVVRLEESALGGVRALVRVPQELVVHVPGRTLPTPREREPAGPLHVPPEVGGGTTEGGLPRRGRAVVAPRTPRASTGSGVERPPSEDGAWLASYLGAGERPEATDREEES